MKLLSEIIALPGWDSSMLLLLAKATIILIAALGITVAMQRASAGARHLVWLITLGALLLVPALATFTPLRLEVLPAKQRVVNAQGQTPDAAYLKDVGNQVANSPAPGVVAEKPTATTPITSTQSSGFFSSVSGVTMLFAIWAAIVLAIAVWLAYGALMVNRIVRHSQPLDTKDWSTPLYEVADRLELNEIPRLLGSSEAKMPFACGFLKPTIVLPADCESWSEDRRRAVLLHELAHVRRRDLIGHTLGRLACAVYWFHPLVWTAAKQLRNESERACDDLALSCGARPSDYAEHLLDIVTSVRGDSTPAVALAMARRKEFEGRMLAILDPELRHSKPSKRQSAVLIGSLAVISIIVGAAAPARRADKIVNAPLSIAQNDSKNSIEFPPANAAKGKQLIAQGGHSDLEIETPKADAPNVDGPTSDTSDSDANSLANGAIKTFTKMAQQTITRVSTSFARQTLENLASDPDEKSIGAKALAALGSVQARGDKDKSDDRPALLANVLRTDTSATLRRIAAWGLSEYAENEIASDALAKALRSDSDGSVREMSAWALSEGSGRNSTATQALIAALKSDSKQSVRETAAWSLGNLESRDAIGPLTDAINDPNPAVRMRAIWAIGNINPRSAPTALVAMLKDRDPRIRELTAWVLYETEDASAAPALNAALHTETDSRLQIAYIRALAAMGEKSVDAIRGLLTSSDPRIKTMAVRALAGGDAAGPWPWPWPEPRPFP
jgi:beta-lactamase regulating signal transducer with metallopeptidase domain/HEAT repeat protein